MIIYYYRLSSKIFNGVVLRVNAFLVSKLLRNQKKTHVDTATLKESYSNAFVRKGQCLVSDSNNKILINHIIPANYKNPFIHLTFFQVLFALVLPSKKKAPQIDKAFIWGNRWSNGYYHFVAEDLPKLLYMQNEKMPVYTWSRHASSWRKELFDLFSIKSILIKGPLLVNKMYYITNNRLSTPKFRFSVLHPSLPPVLTNVVRQFAEKRGLEKGTHKKIIWISRRYTFDRNILNEAACIELLQNNGYLIEVLYPEKLTVLAQIISVYNAAWVIGPHGAGLTNIIFSNNANLIEIGPPSGVNNSFISLAASFNRQYHYLHAKPESKMFKSRSNFSIEHPEDFANNIQKIIDGAINKPGII